MIIKVGKIKISTDLSQNNIYNFSNLSFLFSTSLNLLIEYRRSSCRKYIHEYILEKKEQWKIKKHFFSAGLVGALISVSIHQKINRSGFKQQNYSLLFSYWAALLISIDSHFDLERNEPAKDIFANFKIAILLVDLLKKKGIIISIETLDYFNRWLIENKVHAFVENDFPLVIEKYFLEKFADKLSICIDNSNENITITQNIDRIFEDLISLMTAQILSLKQLYYNECYNWDWYSKNVLKQKFDFIFTSILWAFPKNEIQNNDVLSLIEGMKNIDDVFIHRQILDDLIDFEEDTDNGILATPAYILLAYDNNENINVSNFDFFALKAFENLEKAKEYRKGMFHEAFKNKDKALCNKIIVQSAILRSYFEIVEDEKNYSNAVNRISEIIQQHPNLSNCLSIYFNKSAKSYSKLRQKHSLYPN